MLKSILLLVAVGTALVESRGRDFVKLELKPDHAIGWPVPWLDWSNQTVTCCTYRRWATILLAHKGPKSDCITILGKKQNDDCHVCIEYKIKMVSPSDAGDYWCFLIVKEDHFKVIVPNENKTVSPTTPFIPPTGEQSPTAPPQTPWTTDLKCRVKPKWFFVLKFFREALGLSIPQLLDALAFSPNPNRRSPAEWDFIAIRFMYALWKAEGLTGFKPNEVVMKKWCLTPAGRFIENVDTAKGSAASKEFRLRFFILDNELLRCFIMHRCFGNTLVSDTLSAVFSPSNEKLIVFAECNGELRLMLWTGRNCLGQCFGSDDDTCSNIMYYQL